MLCMICFVRLWNSVENNVKVIRQLPVMGLVHGKKTYTTSTIGDKEQKKKKTHSIYKKTSASSSTNEAASSSSSAVNTVTAFSLW